MSYLNSLNSLYSRLGEHWINPLLAYSKRFFSPSFCLFCNDRLQASTFFCSVCADQIEFLEKKMKCKICFKDFVADPCPLCKDTRYFDRIIILFDSFSPALALLKSKKYSDSIAHLYLVAMHHYCLEIPTEIIGIGPLFKEVAKKMCSLLGLKRMRNTKNLLLLAESSWEESSFLRYVSKKKENITVLYFTESCG